MKSTKTLLACSAGAVAMIASLPAMAQTSSEDVVIATGIRSSLQQSLDLKRNANQVVDAITAEDVGKFPDTNIAESLQRITGVAIDRSGGEGQFITVRGLGPEFNQVLVNGRTMATDNDGREFSFDVFSSDVIQRAEVFKTSTPNLQSGGIGATVNIQTARPLDRPGTTKTISLNGVYDTLREKVSPEGSAVFSWTNEGGNFGFLLGGSYSDRKLQRDRAITNGFSLRSGNAVINQPETSSGLDASDLEALPDGTRLQQQAIFSRDVQDRERITLNSTTQFRDDNVTFTVDGLYSRFDIESFDQQFSGFFSPPFIDPVIDGNGTVTAFSRPSSAFFARNPLLNVPDAGDTATELDANIGFSQNDNVLTSDNRLAESYQVGGNVEWELSNGWVAEFDVSGSNATRDFTNPFVVLGALAPSSPRITLPGDEGIFTFQTASTAELVDTAIQRLHFVNIDRQSVEDDVFEMRGSLGWEGDGTGILRSFEAGALVTERTKSRQAFDNFAALDPSTGLNAANIFCAFCGYNVSFDTSILSEFQFDNFLDGVENADLAPPTVLTASFEDAFRVLNDTANITDASRNDLEGAARTANDQALINRRDATDSIFGFYEPALNNANSFSVDEDISSVYVNTGFGFDMDSGVEITGNVGFRYTETDTSSSGVTQPIIEIRESAGDTQLQFEFAAPTAVTVDNSYSAFLPSFNIKADLNNGMVLRGAVSETITRPTLTSLGVSNVFGGRSNAPTSGGGNPELEAFESTNFDASFEWYIDDLTFFGLAGFHKEFDNFLEAATLPVPRTIIFPAGNGGRTSDEAVTVDFQDTRTRNGEEGSITGLEVSGQYAMDNGFGVSANYTYVTSDIDRDPTSGNADLDYNGLSPHSFNVTGFYEQGPIQARVSYNYRDEFLVQAFDDQSEPREREAFGQLDASAAYDINDTFQVFAEGINILSEDTRDFSRFRNRLLTYTNTGSRFTIGARAAF